MMWSVQPLPPILMHPLQVGEPGGDRDRGRCHEELPHPDPATAPVGGQQA